MYVCMYIVSVSITLQECSLQCNAHARLHKKKIQQQYKEIKVLEQCGRMIGRVKHPGYNIGSGAAVCGAEK